MSNFKNVCCCVILFQLAAVVQVQNILETNKSLKSTATISDNEKTQVIGEGGLRIQSPNKSVHFTDFTKIEKHEESLNSTKVSYSVTANNIKSVNSSNSNVTAITQKMATLNNTLSKPTKPTRTRHDDIPLDQIREKLVMPAPNLPSIDASFEKKTKKADYIIPIVGVIFSVPLLAIIISVVYKYGADWWQHRNYRRMDFLIEGMYNN